MLSSFVVVGMEIGKMSLRSMLADAAIRGVNEARAKIFGHVLNTSGQGFPRFIPLSLSTSPNFLHWSPVGIKTRSQHLSFSFILMSLETKHSGYRPTSNCCLKMLSLEQDL